MPISQFFILTPRGDTIVAKDYRGDVVRGTSEIFFRKLKSWTSDPPPIFSMEGIQFVHIKRNNLYFVGTTKFNVAPAMTLELLHRVANLIKDYTGVLSEESIRVNFVLIYELLDEVMDFGYGQITATEALKAHVHKAPVAIQAPDAPIRKAIFEKKKSLPSSAANKPISLRSQGSERSSKNEIFLDLLERLTVLFSASGSIVRCEIHGAIVMKSFLHGAPEIQLGLNEDMQIGQDRSLYGLVLDDGNFHDCVNLDSFESQRMLTIKPPDGEFTVMNYRISGETRGFANPLPFRVSLAFEDTATPGRTDVLVKLDADFPSKLSGSNIQVKIPMPRGTSSCGHELGTPGHTFAYNKDDKVAVWSVPKMPGASTCYVRLRVCTAEGEQATIRKEVGPVSMEFEVPMFVCSGVNIRFLTVTERGRKYPPCRWVRYITHSDSYVFRT